MMRRLLDRCLDRLAVWVFGGIEDADYEVEWQCVDLVAEVEEYTRAAAEGWSS